MTPGSEDPRIEVMYRRDRAWAFAAVGVLWLVLLFVFFKIMPDSGSTGVTVALLVAGSLVLLFNTAAIAALLRHYHEDKLHLYGLDLHYIDEMKKSKL